MSKLSDKLSDLSSSFGYWITGGSAKGTSLGKTILMGLLVIVPIFLIMAAPWLGWVSIPAEHRYDIQYNWLQDFMWIWPVSLFGVMFLSIIGWLIYDGVQQSKERQDPNKIKW